MLRFNEVEEKIVTEYQQEFLFLFRPRSFSAHTCMCLYAIYLRLFLIIPEMPFAMDQLSLKQLMMDWREHDIH